MQKIQFKVADRDPESEDSHLIWHWRNDPLTRQMSRNTEEIGWEQHKKWYGEAANSPKTLIFLLYIDAHACAMTRFHYIEETVVEINFIVNPADRGKKWGENLLVASCEYGFQQLPITQIYAEIKSENVTSRKIFEQAGFIFQGERSGLKTYLLAKRDKKDEGR